MDLQSLIRTLRSDGPDAFTPARMETLLREARVDARTLYGLPERAGGYTRTRVYADPQFEVALLRWSGNAVSAIHDHAGQACWFVALHGAFDLTNYRRALGGHRPGYARIEPFETLREAGLETPDYRYGERDIHRVAVSARFAEAISLHVYAKPVSACLTYDVQARRCESKAMQWDRVLADRLTFSVA